MPTLYADPILVTDPSAVYWYHAMDLPGVGEVGGHGWDLRPTIDDYFGQFGGFSGARCLDVGAASGFLTFEMERRGAREVVSVDLDIVRQRWDLVPFVDPTYDLPAAEARMARSLGMVQDGYWLAHRLLESRAQVYYGSIYALPEALGLFDVSVAGMVLPHLRYPFDALEQVAALTTDTLIVTQQAPGVADAYAYFMPVAGDQTTAAAWWSLSVACTVKMLGVLGFEVVRTITADHRCNERGDTESCTAIVARRVQPIHAATLNSTRAVFGSSQRR